MGLWHGDCFLSHGLRCFFTYQEGELIMKIKSTVANLSLFGLCWAGWLSTGPLYAAPETKIKLCNGSDQKIYLAVAYEPQAGAPLMSRGWWDLGPNSCNDLSLPLGSDRFLLNATSDSHVLQWAGDQKLCINSIDKFDFENASTMACSGSGLELAGFKELSIAALTQEAGGQTPRYEFKPADAVATGSILKICNDSTNDLYLAIGQRNSTEQAFAVGGWFKILANNCREMLRSESADEMYLYADSSDGTLIWKGDLALCTDDHEGFSFDNAKSMGCDGEHQRRELFKRVPMSGTGAFEYHLKPQAAKAVRTVADLCSRARDTIYVATAFENADFPGEVISIGWFTIEPGQCSKDVVVDASTLYLRVEGKGGTVLMEGPFKACVNTTDGFDFGNSTKMVCSGENQKVVGFDALPVAAGKISVQLP